MRTRLASIILAVLLAACGGDGDDDGTGSDGGGEVPDGSPPPDAGTPDAAAAVTLDDVCDAYVDFFDRLFECNSEVALLLGPLPSDTELAAICHAALGDFVANGDIVLGGADDIAACRAYLAATGCDLFENDIPSACDDVIIGTVPVGGDCDNNEQCAGDAYCAEPQAAADCGACTARLPDGAECSDDAECTHRYCRPGVDATPGECATRSDLGGDCATSTDCLGRQVCNAETGKCDPEPDWMEGTPCEGGGFDAFVEQCGGLTGDLYCHPTNNVCTPYLLLDQPCGTFPEGGLCRIWDYETCQGTAGNMVCTAGQTVGTGEECGIFQGRRCLDGAACRDDDATPDTPDVCVELLDAGAVCDPDNSLCGTLLNCVDGECQYGEYTGMCPAPGA